MEPGQFTKTRGLGGGYGPVQAQLKYWLGRAQSMGTACARWADQLAAQRGIDGLRALIGLVHLSQRHSLATINQACAKASAKDTWRLRDVNALLHSRETQSELHFEEHREKMKRLGFSV